MNVVNNVNSDKFVGGLSCGALKANILKKMKANQIYLIRFFVEE